MESLPLLVQPLLLIAGVALLINSTQMRFSELDRQLFRAAGRGLARRQLERRAERYRNALITLYAALVLLGASLGTIDRTSGADPVTVDAA